MNKHLIIDCSSLLHPIKYTTKSIDECDLIPQRFLQKILDLSFRFRTKNLIFTWEGKGVGYRKELYPEYKENRNKDYTDDEKEFNTECYKQFEICRSLLECIGFKNSFSQPKVEADDIIAKIPKQEECIFHDFVVVSSDGDLLQTLANENVVVYNPSKDKVITKKKFIEEKGIDPKDFWKVKVLAGDTSDNIKGAKGVGEGSAIKYLNGTLKESSVYYQRIINHPKELRSRDSKLVKIPIPQTKPIELLNDEATMEKFVAYCYENGFDTFLNETYDSWERFFGKRETAKQRREKQRNDTT